MIKNLSIGKKFIVGIGLMLLVISAVLLFTYANMQAMHEENHIVAELVIPEMHGTAEIEISMLKTMYAMRGYGLTGNESYYEQAKVSFENTKNYIDEIRELSTKENASEQLGANVQNLENQVEIYSGLMLETEQIFAEIVEAREKLDISAETFVENIALYQENMFEKLNQQVANYDTVERINSRISKFYDITLINEKVQQIRIFNFRAQMDNDAELFQSAYAIFDEVDQLSEGLKNRSTDDYNVEQMENILLASSNYRSAMEVVENGLASLSELASLRDSAGNTMLNISEGTFNAGVEHGIEISENTLARSDRSITFMIWGFVIAILVGIVINTILIKNITSRLGTIAKVANRMSEGDVNVVLDDDSKDEVGQLATAFASMTESIQEQANIAKQIADGNLNVDVNVRSEDDVLNKNFQIMLDTLKKLMNDMDVLVNAAKVGNLSVNMDSSRYLGGWKLFIDHMNSFVSAVEKPVSYVSDYIDAMSDGKTLQMIVAKDEKVKEYIDPLFGETKETFPNAFEGDFSKMINNLAQVRESIYSLLEENAALTERAQEGDLGYRADLTKLRGSWRSIMESFNGAIDTIVLPIEEAAEVLDRMSHGDLSARVMGDYKGDHAKIKNAANRMIDTLSNYIDEIDQTLSKMALGNLDVKVEQNYVGDFQQIKDSLLRIIDSFNQVFNEIGTASDQVSSGAQEVSNSAQALSQGATEQASSIEEITAAITELGQKTRDNAESASNAKDLSLVAKEDALRGNEQMKEMIKAMEEINASSSNISKIISVIDEIAFQTNILALNAAVEAARAGEHGKGFAVVAEEVRNLAARSANAAKETTVLIQGSIDQVKVGTGIAEDTASALDKIVTGVSDAADLVNTIADASNEQAVSITQITEGIDEVSMVTQTNSATAEESAAASEEMSSQAMLLKEMIERFELKKQGNYGTGYQQYSMNKRDDKRASHHDDVHMSDDVETVKIDLDDREFGKY